MRLLAAVFLTAVLGTEALAQSLATDVIRWDVSSLTDTQSGQNLAYSCHFITYPGDKVKWVQDDYIITMDINQTNNNWPSLSGDGYVTYAVEMDNKNGTIVFRREAGVLNVKIDFIEGSENQTPHLFLVSNITVIQP